MAVNIRKQYAAGGGAATGTDLDSVFAAYISGTKAANCGIRTAAGQDLSDRYQPRGVSAKVPDVGYRNAAGSDISNLFAFFGYYPTVTLDYDDASFLRTREGPATTTCFFNFLTTGGWSCTGVGSGGAPTGNWLADVGGGAASDYDALFTVTLVTGAVDSITNEAAVRTQINTTITVGASVSGTDEYGVISVTADIYRRSDNAHVGTGEFEITVEVLPF